ncbi:LOW QUALITY PROTEIN: hypothetical protein V2J09_000775 [Rumex salicifolius]
MKYRSQPLQLPQPIPLLAIDLRDANHSLQMHSSLIRRLTLERKLEGHVGCINSIAWNSQGSLLISGSDDQRINIWRYSTHKLLHCIKTGHTTNIYGTEFIPETSDELVASGAGDCEVRVFNISHLSGRQAGGIAVSPYAHYQCHTKRVKELAVEVGNPNVVWSASEDGTLRQHDFREVCSYPPNGPFEPECRSVLLDLRRGKKRSLSHPPNGTLNLRSCDISVTRPHLILVGGSDAFARLYDRRMLPPLSSCGRRSTCPSCVNYFCPMHLSESTGWSNLHVTHVGFSPNGEEVVISYIGEHVYLFDVNQGASSGEQYTSGDDAKQWSFSPNLNEDLLQRSENIRENCIRSMTVFIIELWSILSCRMRFMLLALQINIRPLLVFPELSDAIIQHNRCRKLLQTAERCLKERSNFHYGIELCNEVLDGHDCSSDPILKHDYLCTRSDLFLKRKWKNDAHMAVRDLKQALKIDYSSYRALYYMSEALVESGLRGEYIASGSDDGRWFVWEKKTGRVIKMLLGDEAGNIWTSSASVPSNPSAIAGRLSGTDTSEVLEAMEGNQHSLSNFLEPLLPSELLDWRGIPESDRDSFERTQCTQSSDAHLKHKDVTVRQRS